MEERELMATFLHEHASYTHVAITLNSFLTAIILTLLSISTLPLVKNMQYTCRSVWSSRLAKQDASCGCLGPGPGGPVLVYATEYM